MKNIKRKIALVLSVFCMLGTVGCNQQDEIMIQKQDITVELIPSVLGNEFWDTVVSGAKDAEYELGINLIVTATDTETDIDGQIKLINDAVSNGVDAIVISPLDRSAIDDALRNATEAGVKVITINSAVTYTGVVSMVSTENEEAASIGAQNLASLINATGDVMVMSSASSANDDNATVKQREDGFINMIEESEEYKNINIKDILYCNYDVQTAKDLTLDYIEKNPSVKAIYATNQHATEGVCEAIEEKGLNGKISIVGWDSSANEIKFIEDGVLNGTLAQSPYLFGYLGVRNAVKSANGEIIDKNINTGIKYINLANLQNNDVQILLNPPEPMVSDAKN